MHNFQRDGVHRQSIARGRVAYEPNTLGSGTEFRVDGGAQGFQSYPEQLEPPKVRRRSPSFDDHFSQAALFWNSQSAPEKDHIVAAFRFELSKVELPEIRQRVVDNLAHVDLKLATRVAAPLGIKPPDPKAAAGRLGFRDHRIVSKVEEDPALRMAPPRRQCQNPQSGHPGGRRRGGRRAQTATARSIGCRRPVQTGCAAPWHREHVVRPATHGRPHFYQHALGDVRRCRDSRRKPERRHTGRHGRGRAFCAGSLQALQDDLRRE